MRLSRRLSRSLLDDEDDDDDELEDEEDDDRDPELCDDELLDELNGKNNKKRKKKNTFFNSKITKLITNNEKQYESAVMFSDNWLGVNFFFDLISICLFYLPSTAGRNGSTSFIITSTSAVTAPFFALSF